jgi:hypothetical protein
MIEHAEEAEKPTSSEAERFARVIARPEEYPQ